MTLAHAPVCRGARRFVYHCWYLPGVKLPENVVAYPSLAEAVTGATLLLFVLPHQVRRGV